MGSINAVQSYIDYYHLPPEGNSGTGIVFAIFQVCSTKHAFHRLDRR